LHRLPCAFIGEADVTLNLTDPASIAAWYRIAPQRHAGYLRHWLRCEMFRAFWPAIEASRELVK
jgi:hypothetical protein